MKKKKIVIFIIGFIVFVMVVLSKFSVNITQNSGRLYTFSLRWNVPLPQDVKLLSYVNETGWFGEGNRLLIVQASNIEGNILFDESKYTHKLV